MATIKSYTDIEQSKKLAEFLPLDTADQCFLNDGTTIKAEINSYSVAIKLWKEHYIEIIPCWSLAALISIYKEALERASNLHKDAVEMENNMTTKTCEIIFPELKESEGEKIRKVLIGWINLEPSTSFNDTFDGFSKEQILAWLEKQSYTKKDIDDAYLKGVTNTKNEIEKQYEANYQIRKDIATFIFNYRGDIKDRAKWMDYLGIKVSFVEKQGEQKPILDFKASNFYVSKVDGKIHDMTYNPTNKAEQKFKVGDWIVQKSIGVFKIIEICESWYEVIDSEDNHYSISFDKEYMCRLWTIQDAKDGDVLACNSDYKISILSICIFAHFDGINNKYDSFLCYCGLEGEGLGQELNINGYHDDSTGYVPATKEQRDTLEKAITNAGYRWDADKKELKQLEPNSAWSEEDENRFRNLIYLVEHSNEGKGTKEGFVKFINRLKALKDRYTWKPTELELEVLKLVAEKDGTCLMGLYKHLKKLREE